MTRKLFLTVYHTLVLGAAIFGNLEPRQKKQLLRHLRLEKAYHAPALVTARARFDRALKTLSVRIAGEIREITRN